MNALMNSLKGMIASLGFGKGEAAELGRFFVGVAGIYLGMVTFGFAAFHIPSESMQPSLEVGDRVLVSKFAYGYSRHSLPLGLGYALPASMNGRIAWASPKRGDVVVFRDERQSPPVNLIKRVIGIEGDVIEVRQGQLFLNGEEVVRTFEESRTYREHSTLSPVTVSHYTETLPDERTHPIYERSDNGWLDDYGPTTIRPGTVFVMGDNRDASNDSRAPRGPGLVPLANVVGRAETVLFTLARCDKGDAMHCPSGRVWSGL
jgi:signal peptidase I